MTSAALPTELEPPQGRVWLRDEDPREGAELVFDFPFDEDLNEAVKRLPKRWFDWRRKNWRVPADARIGKLVAELLGRFPNLEATPEVLGWLNESDRWRAAVTVVAHEGAGAFLLRTLAGDAPSALDGALPAGENKLLLPFDSPAGRRLPGLEGVHLDDLARTCARELQAGLSPAPAELGLEIGDHGEPDVTLFTLWDSAHAQEFRRLPEARLVHRPGRYFGRDGSWAVAVPADPALAPNLSEFIAARPTLRVDDRVVEVLEELVAEHDRASETVALSYAEDAELEDLGLGGVLHPFQRAGVRYALERRRTFIADEQGLGKTVQALATLEADDAFPAVVVCPASMKLMWEREASVWLPERRVTVLDGRTERTWTEEALEAEIVVLNYDILDAHHERLAAIGPRALVLDESHYVKNPGARRTKAAIRLAEGLPDDALRLGLTGTPILNRPEELISQLRALGRLRDFGTGARLSRRFRSASSDDRLHWNLRAHCYVRRTKDQVLPQLPAKRHDTVPVLLSNEQEYRLAERDVVAWLQTLPLDLRTLDAKVAAALRAEQLVRLNNLRQLAVRGKLPTALAWISDFLASGEPLVVFAEHVATQQA
ncbi:MAG: SWI/SNF-related matrix-associated actin-dependent regulator of chromatin subfamily A-like protein 1, partial [Thermoleophilaceae bacterium]|nr:SWI/SNF-related matrix-associated actin-dependent regulator of chromatin subfamily A-like protein 1 [Thermoleophilaceae bacterium]